MLEILAPLLRRVVDEAEQIDPVLGMLEQLPRDQLTDVAGSDDDRVLEIAHMTSAVRARGRAPGRDQCDGCRPEDRDLARRRMGEIRQVQPEDEQARADRDHVEHARELVAGRVVGALLVALVEAVELCDDDPGRKGQYEEDELRTGCDAVRTGTGRC